MSAPLTDLFNQISTLRVGVLGDFAVDAYYPLETETGEQSLETGKAVHRGGKIRTSLGDAGNVVNNFSALGVSAIKVVGLQANDLWGRELLHLLHQKRVDTSGLVLQNQQWQSCAYVKPMLGKEEGHRLDFGSYNQADPQLLNQILDNVEATLPSLNILLLNQQFVKPLLNYDIIQKLNHLALQYSECQFVADLRDLGQYAQGMTLKANTVETAKMLNSPHLDERNTDQCLTLCQALSQQQKCPVLLTRGPYGMIYSDGSQTKAVPGIWHDGEVDPVGAGDTAISTFAACQAVNLDIAQCLKIANAASAVTVRKLHQTGTASPNEIQSLLADCTYVYHPYRADHPDTANYFESSLIEVVEEYSVERPIKFAMFDHDGTISVLRQGWEEIMQPLMLRSIAGDALTTLSSSQKDTLAYKITQLIGQTTGAPTIVQMEGLVELIQREGYVPASSIHSPKYYKQEFLQLLNDLVNDRISRFQRGELGIEDFTLKGAIPFLQKLRDISVELYLASGTDEENVKQEANTLGYGSWFTGGIYGARPDGMSAKRKVLQQLLQEKQAKPSEILVIGDGPSEIREGRKEGAICVGIASDEIRRFGMNYAKRKRLIRAGAHFIISDYAQPEALFNLFFPKNY
ncbi:MAG: PfkB family carbohydrate kinase [Tunicatimonas sp.]|uniref:PfkB family carbohydrate kinase n=1 Tax=Tunicatimonas sp. TaxID=1940096 RepID=UPI003C7098EC